MPTIHVDLRELSGLSGDAYVAAASLRVAHMDRIHVESGGDDYVLTRNFLIVKILDGEAEFDVPATPDGHYLAINEDGFEGAHTRYVIVPDEADINYGDLVDIDPASLDPAAVPEALWWAELDEQIVDGEVVGNDLILERQNGTTVNAGNVRGTAGPPGGSIAGYIRPEDYGAVGDGVTDDTDALVEAFADAAAAGGGFVLLTARYAWTGDLEQKTGVSVTGSGMSDFVTATGIGLVALDGTSRYRYGNQAGNSYPGPLQNLQINGNDVGGATELVRIEAVNGAIRDVVIEGGAGNGFDLAGAQNCSLDHVSAGFFPNGAAILLDNRDDEPDQNPNTQGAGGNKIINSYFHASNVLVRQTYNDNGHTHGFWPHDNIFFGCLFEQRQDDCHSIVHIADGEIQFDLCAFTGSSGLINVDENAVMFVENQLRPTSATIVTLTSSYLGGGAEGVPHLIRSNSYGLFNLVRLMGRSQIANVNQGFVLCDDRAGGGLGAVFDLNGPFDGETETGVGIATGINGGSTAAVVGERLGGMRWRMQDDMPNPIQIRRYGDSSNRIQMTRDGNVSWFDGATTTVKASLVRSGAGLLVNGENIYQVYATTTALRPPATDAAYLRRMILDTTLNKLIVSDGTVWRDAMGTAV